LTSFSSHMIYCSRTLGVQMVEPKREVMRKFQLQHAAALKRLDAAKEALNQMKVIKQTEGHIFKCASYFLHAMN